MVLKICMSTMLIIYHAVKCVDKEIILEGAIE